MNILFMTPSQLVSHSEYVVHDSKPTGESVNILFMTPSQLVSHSEYIVHDTKPTGDS